jgi:geranylgeranyl reductase family protein
MIDVIVAGAGPAGSVAALVLARAGARVWILEREQLPRAKLCGDTINPGAVDALAALGLTGGPLLTATRLDGMIVSGPRVEVRGAYTRGQVALAIPRAALDHWLAEAAVAAGARLECGTRVRGLLWRDSATVAGVEVSAGSGVTTRVPAQITIAADGRRSVLARAARLSRHPLAPRRWAFGTYATDVAGMSSMGEMHVRRQHYIGLAPMGGGLTNVCVVTGPRPEGRAPIDIMRRALDGDADLRERTRAWRPVAPPQVLGPLAVDTDAAGVPGLLLAGDAAGFVDPMTGDGLHLAIRGGVLAAMAALDALESGDVTRAAEDLRMRRAGVLGSKLRFNRWLRQIVASPIAMDVVGLGATLAPALLRRVVRYAGDAA